MTQTQSSNGAAPVRRDIVVMGASAGGVETLAEVVKALPADFGAAVFVVLHVSPHGTSVLPDILTRRGPLPAHFPYNNERYEAGHIYVAPPDRHLLIEGDHIRVSRGPSENGSRPAIDPLFRSAARTGGGRVIAVVLSGMLDDGTSGLMAVKQLGGIAVVQEPHDALFAGMPTSAIQNVAVDYVVPANQVGPLLTRLVQNLPETSPMNQPEPPLAGSPDETAARSDVQHQAESITQEVRVSLMEPDTSDVENKPDAAPSVYSCPECGGVLWEVKSDSMLRFRCRTGHAYSADSLLAEQTSNLEDALWSALRAIEESGSLARRLAERAHKRGFGLSEAQFVRQAEDADQRASVIRDVLLTGQVFSGTNATARQSRPASASPVSPAEAGAMANRTF